MAYELYAVRIFSFRWDEALAFYRDRIGFVPTYVDEQLGWAEFKLGGARIALERSDPNDPESKELVGRFVGVSIHVDDIRGLYQRLRDAGVSFPGPPERQPWGGVLAHFADPDGNVLTLMGSDEGECAAPSKSKYRPRPARASTNCSRIGSMNSIRRRRVCSTAYYSTPVSKTLPAKRLPG